MKELRNTEIAVVGLGLMGGSIAGALQGRCRSVVGIGRRESTIEAAIERGLVDRATDDLASGVREADVVILATPVRTIMQQIREVIPLLSEGALLMDLGSTKVEIMKEMDSLPEHVQPVGGAPDVRQGGIGNRGCGIITLRRLYFYSHALATHFRDSAGTGPGAGCCRRSAPP